MEKRIGVNGALYVALQAGRPEMVEGIANAIRDGDMDGMTNAEIADLLMLIKDSLVWKLEVQEILKRLDNIQREATGFINTIESVREAVERTYDYEEEA